MQQGIDLGIDLGTTKCAAAIAVRGVDEYSYRVVQIEQRADADHIRKVRKDVLPSVVYVNRQGQIVVGEAAFYSAFHEPEMSITSAKLFLGKDIVLRLNNGRTFTPVEVAKILLETIIRSVRGDGHQIRRCVVTVPASFNLRQKNDTKKAAVKAGIPEHELMLLDEPTAAFLSFYTNKQNPLQALLRDKGELVVLVVDIGGGTFDVSVIHLGQEEGILQPTVLTTSQHSEGAGDDFDEAIAKALALKYVYSRADFDFNALTAQQKISLAGALLSTAKEIKHGLSLQKINGGEGVEHREVSVPTSGGYVTVPVEMNFEELEDALSPYCSTSYEVSIQAQLLRVLQSEELRARLPYRPRSQMLDLVLIAGQMGQLWLVQDAISQVVSGVPIQLIPGGLEYAVAKGAAVHAATRVIKQQYLPTDILLRMQRGFYPLAKRGMPLPIPTTFVRNALHVPHNRCRGMSLQLWEGTEERYDELQLLVDQWVPFPEPQHEGQAISLTWSMSRNYQLSITPALGKQKLLQVKINSQSSGEKDE